MYDLEHLQEASKHLTEATKSLRSAGMSEFSSTISRLREINGMILLQIDVKERREANQVDEETRRAATYQYAFGEIPPLPR